MHCEEAPEWRASSSAFDQVAAAPVRSWFFVCHVQIEKLAVGMSDAFPQIR
jgi:hypothetical protein